MTDPRPVRAISSLRHRDFRFLWGALTLSDFGDAVGRIALVILVFEETGSGLVASLVPALSVVPFLGPGQFLTAHVERFARRTVLVTADVARAACFAGMALPMPVAGRLALLTIASVAEPPFLAVRRALTPATLPEAEYPAGIRVTSASTEIALLVGAATGGLLTQAVGAELVMAVNAATFIFSALLLSSMSSGALQIEDIAASASARLRRGFDALRRDPVLRLVVVAFPAISAAALGAEAIVAPYVALELRRPEEWVGYLAAVVSIGVLLGAALLPQKHNHRGLVIQMCRVGALGTAGALGAFLAPSGVYAAIAAFLAVGVVYSCRVPAQVLYGQRLPDAVRSSGASIADGFYAVAQIVGSVAAGAASDRFGPATTVMALVGFGLTAAVAFGLAARRLAADELVRSSATG